MTSRSRAASLLVGLLPVASLGCHPPAPPPPGPLTLPSGATPSCAESSVAPLQQALQAGRLERARRLLEDTLERCPSDPTARRALLSTLVTLGHRAQAAALVDQIEADASAPADERDQARRLLSTVDPVDDAQAVAWVREGMEALQRGDAAGGQWLLDRALVALEGGRARVSLDLPNGPRGALPWRPSSRLSLGRRSRPPLAASADGRLFAHGEGPEVRVLDAATGREVHAFRLPGAAQALAFAPDAPVLAAVGSDRAITLWNLSTGQGRRLTPTVAPQQLALTAGGRVVVGGDEGAEWWDAAGHGTQVEGVLRGVAQDGQLLVERAGRWTLVGGAPGGWSARAAGSALLSPSGAWVAVAGERGAVELRSTRGGASRALEASKAKAVQLVASSPDGEWLLATSEVGARLWSTTTGRLQTRDGWRAAALVGEHALLESDGKWALWRVTDGAWRELHDRPGAGPREMLAVGPLLLSGGSHEVSFRRWDLASGQPIVAFDTLHAEALGAPAVRADDHALAGVDPDGSVRLIWSERGEQQRLSTGGELTRGAAFVGPHLSAFAEGKLRLFDAQDGRLVGLHERPAVGKQMGAFGGPLLATLSSHGWLQLFDVAAGHSHKTLEGARQQRTQAVAVSPAGRWVAAGERGGEVRLWELGESDEPRQVFTEQQASVRALTFVGGDQLCSGDEGGTVLCRHLPDGAPRPLHPTTPLGEVMSLAPLTDGTLLVVSQSLLGVRARVFDLAGGKQLRSLGELLPLDGDAVTILGDVLIAPSTLTGSTLLLRVRDGVPLGALRVLRDGRGAYFLGPSGRIELLGTPLRGVGACRVGHRSFPAELCLDRFDTPGLLRQALAGEPG